MRQKIHTRNNLWVCSCIGCFDEKHFCWSSQFRSVTEIDLEAYLKALLNDMNWLEKDHKKYFAYESPQILVRPLTFPFINPFSKKKCLWNETQNKNATFLLFSYYIIPRKSEHKKCLKQQITIKTHIKITQVQITQPILLHVPYLSEQTHKKNFTLSYFLMCSF